MSLCLICAAELSQTVTWRSVIFLEKEETCCSECLGKFTLIEGPVCRTCGRPQADEQICYDCERWQYDELGHVLTSNRSVYHYNDSMKDVIARYKYRGDAALVRVFKDSFRQAYNQHFKEAGLIVPVPLSSERLYERGFNQALLLAELLGRPVLSPLNRKHLEKQSKKTREERLQSENVFFIENPSDILSKHILLIDDIYTTGTTIRQAANVLIQNGAKKVSSLTLVRG
ncbi:ComF family protein [Metabacillus indicus]|uniref:ComF family protein n=1 Tax=Metabacillus indicus TaxID=246786 RepID=UPI0024901B80|nr:ComF family protein [Metabacillus indicus]